MRPDPVVKAHIWEVEEKKGLKRLKSLLQIREVPANRSQIYDMQEERKTKMTIILIRIIVIIPISPYELREGH